MRETTCLHSKRDWELEESCSHVFTMDSILELASFSLYLYSSLIMLNLTCSGSSLFCFKSTALWLTILCSLQLSLIALCQCLWKLAFLVLCCLAWFSKSLNLKTEFNSNTTKYSWFCTRYTFSWSTLYKSFGCSSEFQYSSSGILGGN